MKTLTTLLALAFAIQLQATPTVTVNLTTQKLTFVVDKKKVLSSDVSTGMPGKETPTGTFAAGELEVKHKSGEHNCVMPFAIEIDGIDGGVYLHGGNIYGYPSSHKCVRVEKAEELFKLVFSQKNNGHKVVIKIEGDSKGFYRNKFGELLTYDSSGAPTGFRREEGKLTADFKKAYKEHKITLFCEDLDGNLDLQPLDKKAEKCDTTNWFFSIECWGEDRRKKGIPVAEVESFMGLRPHKIQITEATAVKMAVLYKLNDGKDYMPTEKK